MIDARLVSKVKGVVSMTAGPASAQDVKEIRAIALVTCGLMWIDLNSSRRRYNGIFRRL